MAVQVAPPNNVSAVFTIQPDGSLKHMTGELGSAGPAGLGTNVVCVINLDQNQPMGTVIQAIYANAGIPAIAQSSARA